jgi:hypothetical protein
VGQGIKDAPKGWFSLYLYPFTYGLHFPFPTLIPDFLANLNVAISQIMPYAWRVLLTAKAMCEAEGKSISLGDLLLSYKYRSLGDMTYTLWGIEGRKSFVHMGKEKDQGWRGAFVYVKTDSLEYDMSFVPGTLKTAKGKTPCLADVYGHACLPGVSLVVYLQISITHLQRLPGGRLSSIFTTSQKQGDRSPAF